jgi:hypothetical protein
MTILFAALFLLASCVSYRNIEVKDFEVNNVTMQGTKILIDFSATVQNPNRTIVVQQAEGEVGRGQQSFAAVQLLEAITIAAKSEQRCSGKLQLTLHDLLAALQIGADYRSWEMSSFLFTGDVQVKAGGLKKKYKYTNAPVSQIINSLQ